MAAPLIIANFPSIIGGGEISVIELTEELIRRGHKPLLAVPEGGYFQFEFDYIVRKIPADILGAASEIKKIADECDIIHSNGHRGLISAWLARTGKPLIWHTRVAASDKLDPILKLLPDAIISNSYATAKRFGTNKKVKVIYNGIKDIFPSETNIISDKNLKYIAVIGRMTPEKGHLDLIPAINTILSQEKNIAFYFAGENSGSIGNKFRELQKQFGKEKIIMPGYIKNVSEFFYEFELIIIPSRIEGFGRVAVEAMQQGITVLVRKTGGLAEILEGLDELFLPEDINLWADKILSVLNKHPVSKDILFERASRFSISRCADEILELYENLIQSSKTRGVKDSRSRTQNQ